MKFDKITEKKLQENVASSIATDYFKRKKLYFAGPWFDNKSSACMKYIMHTYNLVKGSCEYDVYFPCEHQYNTPSETVKANIHQIENCDLMVAFISKKDIGTAWEIGMATMLDKPIYYIVYDKDDLKSKTNIMLCYCAKGAMEMRNWRYFLLNHDVQLYKFNDSWEGKE